MKSAKLAIKMCKFCTLLLCKKVQIMHLILTYEVQIMNEKNKRYEKRLAFQQKMINRQSEQIEKLKGEIERLNNKLIEKDEIITSIDPMRKEMEKIINEQKKRKEEYKSLIDELKKMKEIVNQTVYKGRWWIIRHLIK